MQFVEKNANINAVKLYVIKFVEKNAYPVIIHANINVFILHVRNYAKNNVIDNHVMSHVLNH